MNGDSTISEATERPLNPHAKIISPKTAVCIEISQGFSLSQLLYLGNSLWLCNFQWKSEEVNSICKAFVKETKTASFKSRVCACLWQILFHTTLWISLECSLASISALHDSCHRLVPNWSCNITVIPVPLAPVSALLYFCVSGWMCMCVQGRARERERVGVVCGNSFRSNCVELDSTQECTKRLDWFCCIVSRKPIKRLTQYCRHESHESVIWPRRSVFRGLCEVERLFLGTYKIRRWTQCVFFLHLSARTLLNVIQDHFDDLDKRPVFELLCVDLVFFYSNLSC